MRRLKPWDYAEIVAYNLRDNGTAVTVFADAQTDRVERAREYIDTILAGDYDENRALIVEPGCSAGDISGPYAREHTVQACDVVPAAVRLARERYPKMHVEQCTAEDFPPRKNDILVLCEFLEHIVDPIGFVKAWLPMSRFSVIGHPLVGDGYDPEPGHLWAYTMDDFDEWFSLGGHVIEEVSTFPMGPYTMVLGWGRRR
jgi:hypothetical protein